MSDIRTVSGKKIRTFGGWYRITEVYAGDRLIGTIQTRRRGGRYDVMTISPRGGVVLGSHVDWLVKEAGLRSNPKRKKQKRRSEKRRSEEQHVAYAYSPAPVSTWRMQPSEPINPVAAVFSPIKPARTNWWALGGLAALGLGLMVAFTPPFPFSPPSRT